MFFFFSSRRRHTRSYGDWSSDVCSSDLHDVLRYARRIATLLPADREQDVVAGAAGAAAALLSLHRADGSEIGRGACRGRGGVSGGGGVCKTKKDEGEDGVAREGRAVRHT